MAMPVLATKLYIPPPRAQAIARPRLVTRTDEGLRSGKRLTLVSAPAGFGKSTLLSEWIAEIQSRQTSIRVAWLSLEAHDNDPVRFLNYVISALRTADPEIRVDLLTPQSAVDVALAALVNEVNRVSSELVLVLDDFQFIEEPSIQEAMVFLLEHLPSNLHLVISSRSDPLLPLARLRARGEITELRAADLRFTPDEASAFLTQTMGLALSSADVAALEDRTEGWVAGLQLAALSLQNRTDVTDFVAAFAGSNRFVVDYLMEEVLNRTPLHVRDFLFQTAILDRLSGPLCDAVTRKSDSEAMLESLERANLFVIPLDDHRGWFRYHHLFVDVLRARLLADGPEHVAALHRLASEWFEKSGDSEDAVRHALEAQDFPRAARIIEATIPLVRKSRQDWGVLNWLAALPEETIARRPVLVVFSAWSSLVSGDIAAVEPQLAHAELLLTAPPSEDLPAHDSEPGPELAALPVTIALYRASLALATGDLPKVEEQAALALALAQPVDYLGQGAAAGLLGLERWASGELENGVRAFGESAASLRRAGNLTDALTTTLVIADMLVPLGRLRETQAAYELALREASDQLNGGLPAADLHSGISEVLSERGELEVAEEHLLAAEKLGEAAFSHEHRYRWFVSMARVRQAHGQSDAALDLLAEAEKRYRRGFFAEARPIDAMKARIWITQNRLAEARAWADQQSLTSRDKLSYLSEYAHITLARLLLAERAPGAIGLLDRLLEAAEASRRSGVANEILVLQALAYSRQGDDAHAREALNQALEHAEPEGYVRLFVDEGAPMEKLLRAAIVKGRQSDYVHALLQAFSQGEDATPATGTELVSDRELQVLKLLASELTGPEIARELFISLNTLRTHTRHIFEKLGVNSRIAAVQHARTLGLI
ncbi:LuxR C-terminal-related transcriptional regulator [Homoserinimonas sp. OAct 916]|uniref:LuxR C-terminal-related transcriptional regulator n=1 Tax=Homoserinimonas sp. OAct 916 TaxID=2211450 RepID=UPI000DBE79F6|nr:LuxR C-terminal-related transcriptional regulator [Homoserinimonas sp. OAct 916]